MSKEHENHHWKGAIDDLYFTNEETDLEGLHFPSHSELEADINR